MATGIRMKVPGKAIVNRVKSPYKPPKLAAPKVARSPGTKTLANWKAGGAASYPAVRARANAAAQQKLRPQAKVKTMPVTKTTFITRDAPVRKPMSKPMKERFR